MKKVLLILGVILVAAIATPSASAALVWADKGVEIGANKAIPMEGSILFKAEAAGQVNCTSGVKASITLEAGTSKGSMTEFAPDVSKCVGGGVLAGCTVTAIDVEGLPWSLNFAETKFSIPAYKGAYTLHGFLCPTKVTISGGAGGPTATPDPSAAELKELTIGGQATASTGGAVQMEGTFAPTNGGDVGTYGLAPAFVWADKGVEIGANKAIPMQGSILFKSEAAGQINCTSVKTSITLEAGTNKGSMTEFAPEVAKCDTGGILVQCKVTGVDPEGLPWSLNFAETKFSIPAYKVIYTIHGFLCPTTTISGGAGGPTATPDPSAAEIKELTIGGQATATPGGNVQMEGTFAPTNGGDVGTYGLA